MTTLIRPMVDATVGAATSPWPSGPGLRLFEVHRRTRRIQTVRSAMTQFDKLALTRREALKVG